MRETKRENNELNARLKQMEKELKAASKGGGGGGSDVSEGVSRKRCLKYSFKT